MEKAALRKVMYDLRSTFSPEDAKKKQREAEGFLFDSAIWNNSPEIVIFVSFKNEFSTNTIIEEAWRKDKKLLTPKVTDRKSRQMGFVRIKSWRDLKEGYMGIPEPAADKFETLAEDGLLLMPGLAFDHAGWRLGYGGGFYDTYLGNLKIRPKTVGLCYREQLIENVPHDQFDIPVEGICSDAGLEWVRK